MHRYFFGHKQIERILVELKAVVKQDLNRSSASAFFDLDPLELTRLVSPSLSLLFVYVYLPAQNQFDRWTCKRWRTGLEQAVQRDH